MQFISFTNAKTVLYTVVCVNNFNHPANMRLERHNTQTIKQYCISCVNVCTTSLYLVNNLVTCCYSI